jgi:uncharacterized membrane protein YcaP (DUF421 family)
MAQGWWESVQSLLGQGSEPIDVGVVQMLLRTLLVYAFTLAMVRVGSQRLLAKASIFDVIVAIMLGSIMSRAINGSAPLLPTLAAGLGLLAVHWLLAVVAFHTDWLGSLVKGDRILLIKDGEIQREGMRQASITDHDLRQALRTETHQTDPSRVEVAYLERSGKISVVPSTHEPRVVDVSVAAGVQTVRIELD